MTTATNYYFFASDSWWQERFRVPRDEWVVNIGANPSTDSVWMQSQLDAWESDFTLRAGLPHTDRPVVWNQPPKSPSYGKAEIIGFLLGEQSICETWDCGAIALDFASLGAQMGRDLALFSISITSLGGASGFSVGQTVNSTLAVTSLMYTTAEFSSGEASTADLAVAYTATAVGFVPVAGEFATMAQLIWDFLDPFHPW